jgi:glycosyltransferase involved in cell wall biosynthesis
MKFSWVPFKPQIGGLLKTILPNNLILPIYYDSWGLVVNEAMACSLPVVVTDAAGCYPDLVTDGSNGHVVKAGDVSALTDAIRVLMNAELRKRFGQESRRIIKQWTYSDSRREFLKAIDFCLQLQAGSPSLKC